MEVQKSSVWLVWFVLMLVIFGPETIKAKKSETVSPPADSKLSNNSAPDSTQKWDLHLGARLQFQTKSNVISEPESDVQFNGQLRRLRLKLYGTMPWYDVKYFIMPSFDKGEADLELGYMAWEPGNLFALKMGQFKVPATRQFMISSGALQLVDRSFVDAMHRQLYDLGIMGRYRFKLDGHTLFQLYASITTGEGRGRPAAEGGYSYTVRGEFLPFGNFNQYRLTDLTRAKNLRLSLATAYNLNMDAVQTGGTIGTYMNGAQTDIGTAYADLLIKYGGWSLSSQYSDREAEDPRPLLGNQFVINEGSTILVQSGYMITKESELIGSYSNFEPNEVVSAAIPGESRYTVGYTRFFQGDNFKLQFDVSWIDRDESASVTEELLFRGQIQMDF